MARIYTSRQLLDPSLISMANQAMQNRITTDAARRKNVIDAWSKAANTLGSSLDKYIAAKRAEDEQNKRYNELLWNSSEADRKDPAYLAAINEYARTGSASPLSNLILQRQAAEARKQAAEQAKVDKDAAEQMHKAVRLEQARGQYAKNLQGYNAAQSNAEKQQFLLANKALEREFGSEPFGQTMDDYAAAKAKDEVEARQLAYELEQDKKEQKAIEDKSYDVKNWIRENIIPLGAIKRKEDQIEIADFIRNSKGLTEADRKELLDEVLKNKTQAEAVRAAQQGAAATHAGKKTTESLEEADNRNKAKKYVGKKLNALELNKIPEEVRQYLKIDGKGNVTEK
jgi:hypothetical protein